MTSKTRTNLTPLERTVACRNLAAHLRNIACKATLHRQIALVCLAAQFQLMAMEAEQQVRSFF